MPGAGSSGLRNIVKIKIQFKGLLISNNSDMTRSVRRGLLGLLLLGLIGAAFADMKATSAEAEVKSIEHALKPEPKLLKLFAFSFYFLFLVSDSARTGRRRVEARRGLSSSPQARPFD